jgi:glycosyltransferase involved in cell wall biosynthesis
MKKKRILFYVKNTGGISYYRMQTPAIELERIDNSENFHVEIISKLDFSDPNTLNYLKEFDIIHYHRQLVNDERVMLSIMNELRSSGVKLIVDIDDYWELNKEHPLYEQSKRLNYKEVSLFNMKFANYVTTTTDILADEIKKIRGDDNVLVFENSVNPEWMTQFKNNHKKDPNGLVRITYMGGSAHLHDLKQLENVFNILNSDLETKNKFKIILAGWDSKGKKIENVFNKELNNELIDLNLWNKRIVEEINKSQGNIWKIKSIPKHLKEKYQNNMFIQEQKDIETKESVYFDYEKILTNNHNLINNALYRKWLMNFEINGRYYEESNFARRWTKPPNEYARVLDETDIVIAPLEDNMFNKFKSELKQTECWSRKLPIVCSDIIPYNVYGKHMENCILIPNKKNNKKHWAKQLKKLILDEGLREELGNKLYEDFSERFHLSNVTKKRLKLYKNILNM